MQQADLRQHWVGCVTLGRCCDTCGGRTGLEPVKQPDGIIVVGGNHVGVQRADERRKAASASASETFNAIVKPSHHRVASADRLPTGWSCGQYGVRGHDFSEELSSSRITTARTHMMPKAAFAFRFPDPGFCSWTPSQVVRVSIFSHGLESLAATPAPGCSMMWIALVLQRTSPPWQGKRRLADSLTFQPQLSVFITIGYSMMSRMASQPP